MIGERSAPFDNGGDWQAYVSRDHMLFSVDLARVMVRQKGYGRATVLLEDGSWREYTSSATTEAVSDPQMGLLIPVGAIQAIGRAIEEFQGAASHSATESKVLREWLASERERVDKLVERGLR